MGQQCATQSARGDASNFTDDKDVPLAVKEPSPRDLAAADEALMKEPKPVENAMALPEAGKQEPDIAALDGGSHAMMEAFANSIVLQPEAEPGAAGSVEDEPEAFADIVVSLGADSADSTTAEDEPSSKPKAQAKKHAIGQWRTKADPNNEGVLFILQPDSAANLNELIIPKPKPKPKPQKKLVMTAEERATLERQNKLRATLKANKDKKEEIERNKEYYAKLAEDALRGTGDFAKKGPGGGGQPKGNMRIRMPTPADRANTRKLILGQFRDKYAKLGQSKAQVDCPSSAPTSGYGQLEMSGLTIQGGHMAMARPESVKLPKDYMKPLGTITLEQLNQYDHANPRRIVSVYGDLFDVSDRPDKYDSDGPYWFMSGHDLTWGFVSGRDSEELCDKCFDLWKIAPEGFRDSKLKLIYAWVAWYEYEYGNSVGKLDLYVKEAGLKGPPMEESEDCSIM